MQNIRPWLIETASDFRSVINNWNIKTAYWLHSYVYSRVRPGKKPGLRASMLAYLVSAFWHVRII